jgi:hypothetical protein
MKAKSPQHGGLPAGLGRAGMGVSAPEEVFERVGRRLLVEHPEDEWGRMLHSLGLKTSGKFYAFTTRGELAVKLPAARVSELIASGSGGPCEPRKGRPMREWVRLSVSEEDTCATYLREARGFVAADASGVERREETDEERRAT